MGPLTAQQRELAAQNVGLVRVQVRRLLQRLPVRVRRREREDLTQAGMLGLMRAAANYLPDRHGLFSSYCAKYVHGSLCRYLLRQMHGLAVPTRQAVKVVRQRHRTRVAAWRAAQGLPVEEPGAVGSGGAGRGAVPPLPGFFELHTSGSSLAKIACGLAREAARMEVGDQPSGARRWTTREFRERYVQALEWAARKVKASASAHVDHAALVQAVVEERLRVPDPKFRTARRALSTRFGCSPTRVWNIEVRLLRRVRQHLAGQAGLSRDSATLIYRGGPFGGSAEALAPGGLTRPTGACCRATADKVTT